MVRSWFPLTRSRANIIKQKSHPDAVILEDWGPQDCDHNNRGLTAERGWLSSCGSTARAGPGAEALGRNTRV